MFSTPGASSPHAIGHAVRIAYLHYLSAQDTARHHVAQFTAAAAELGAEVVVAAMNPVAGEEAVGAEGSLWWRARGSVKDRFSRYLHEPKELVWNARYVARELKVLARLRPDVLLVRDHTPTASCVVVAHRLGLPLVIEFNAPADEAHLYLDEYWHVPVVGSWLEGLKLRHADAVTVVSTALRDHLVGRHGVDAGKFAVVPNGADTARFHPDVAPDAALPRGDSPVIGFVGSFSRWHGTELLADMILVVGRARPKARFLLVGDGAERIGVTTAIASLGDRVLWTGSVPHERVPGLVAAMDVGVVPDAGFYMSPLKALEWMAAGRALAAPDTGPLREIAEDGVHALLFRQRSRDDLVATVLRLVDEPGLRRRLGDAAMARVRTELTWTDNARKVLAACERARALRRGDL